MTPYVPAFAWFPTKVYCGPQYGKRWIWLRLYQSINGGKDKRLYEETLERTMTQYIPSTSDARTLNNSTKQHYRVLTDAEKAQVDIVKQRGAEFIAFLHEIGGTDPEAERMASRDLSLAMTHMEDAVMRAVRHITK